MKLSGFSKYELRAPSEIQFSIKGRIKLQTKSLFSRGLPLIWLRLAFLGSDTPSTFTANYYWSHKRLEGYIRSGRAHGLCTVVVLHYRSYGRYPASSSLRSLLFRVLAIVNDKGRYHSLC